MSLMDILFEYVAPYMGMILPVIAFGFVLKHDLDTRVEAMALIIGGLVMFFSAASLPHGIGDKISDFVGL